ncbi:unnamed protein product [marine sediment metagenome]|uniref:Archaeal Type IV pilin N-terminal domain-containing protein n=1 Tax=marine sediment metagenome TaxID=412755 RepID=X1MSC4_9ZZZZ
MRMCKKGQGATEYLLMLAAVLVIVAIAVYYVTTAGAGYPAISATSAKVDNAIRINVTTGSIPTGEWAYSVSSTEGSPYTWTTGEVELTSPYVSLGTYASGTYYVSLKHVDSAHFYFNDQPQTVS